MIKIIIGILLFLLGFSLGQNHKPGDLNGDGRIDSGDVRWIGDKVTHKGKI